MPDHGRFTDRPPRAVRRASTDGLGGAGQGTAGARRRASRDDTARVPAVLLRPASSRREYLLPSSVILAGVLAVLAVAFAVTGGIRRGDEPAALPPAQPPIFGSQPLAPADDGYFPAPGAQPSPSASPRPGDSAKNPPRTTRPPSRSRTDGAPANALAISRAAVPASVDLSAEGTRDWVHWGLDGTFSLERRKAGGFAILEGTPTAPRHRHALSPQRFVWADGQQVQRTSGTPSGIRTCGTENGFTVSAPAGRQYRTLRLYLGVTKGLGRLDARLSTGGSPVRAVLESRSAFRTSVFTLTYRAPRAGKLTVTWMTEKSFDSSCGGVAVQAATLR